MNRATRRSHKVPLVILPDLWAIVATKPGHIGWSWATLNGVRALMASDNPDDVVSMREHAQAIADQGNCTTTIVKVTPVPEVLETFTPSATAVQRPRLVRAD